MRLQADFDNYRKRNESEKVALRSSVRGDTVAELLPLVRRAGGTLCLAWRLEVLLMCAACSACAVLLPAAINANCRVRCLSRLSQPPPCHGKLITLPPFLPLRQVDNFELAKQQLKLETEGEKRVDAAYQVGIGLRMPHWRMLHWPHECNCGLLGSRRMWV